jgi:hypothetical protein
MRYAWTLVLVGCTVGGPDPRDFDPGSPFPEPPTTPFGIPDSRLAQPVVQASQSLPPLSGGTLLVSRSEDVAFASDPDRDRLMVIELAVGRATPVPLEPGDEPGRLVEDDRGNVHVVLRGSGAIATYDRALHRITARRPVCVMPRGIAFDAGTNELYVACREGLFVTLDAGSNDIRSSVLLRDDLRDVVAENGRIWVSVFRRARVLEVDRLGQVRQEIQLPGLAGDLRGSGDFAPVVAWRMRAALGGGVTVLHQRASLTAVEIDTPQGYGGGGGMCPTGIVHAALSSVGPDGRVSTSGPLASASVAVDFVEVTDGYWVVSAGNLAELDAVQHFQRELLADPFCVFGTPAGTIFGYEQLTSIDVSASNRLAVQAREPAVVFDEDGAITALGGNSIADTGHRIFHMRASMDPFGGGMACASCHPEAGDDSHTWAFAGHGQRRTQSLEGGITGGEPFHWTGDMPSLEVLAHDVFGHRMGGVELPEEHIGALRHFLDSVPASPTIAPADPAAAARGETLFRTAQCSTCHAGARMTNNLTLDVGTGLALQVPSLVGVSRRAPFMHDGCAATLEGRFTRTECGGDRHGEIASLTAAQIDDLVAYLETL